jgi:hypothetical protein
MNLSTPISISERAAAARTKFQPQFDALTPATILHAMAGCKVVSLCDLILGSSPARAWPVSGASFGRPDVVVLWYDGETIVVSEEEFLSDYRVWQEPVTPAKFEGMVEQDGETFALYSNVAV